jgi:hypothetical protein
MTDQFDRSLRSLADFKGSDLTKHAPMSFKLRGSPFRILSSPNGDYHRRCVPYCFACLGITSTIDGGALVC